MLPMRPLAVSLRIEHHDSTTGGRLSVGRKWQPLLPEERQLVPVTSLKDDLAIDDVEEAAPAQPERILPFQDGPLAVFEEVLHDTHHRGGRESLLKHRADGVPSMNRSFRHL